jgi:nitrogen regulatory protein PII-like uncharacterized protein
LNLTEGRSILRGTQTEPSEEWKAVIRDVSRSAVVIVAVTKSANGVRLEQAGPVLSSSLTEDTSY